MAALLVEYAHGSSILRFALNLVRIGSIGFSLKAPVVPLRLFALAIFIDIGSNSWSLLIWKNLEKPTDRRIFISSSRYSILFHRAVDCQIMMNPRIEIVQPTIERFNWWHGKSSARASSGMLHWEDISTFNVLSINFLWYDMMVPYQSFACGIEDIFTSLEANLKDWLAAKWTALDLTNSFPYWNERTWIECIDVESIQANFRWLQIDGKCLRNHKQAGMDLYSGQWPSPKAFFVYTEENPDSFQQSDKRKCWRPFLMSQQDVFFSPRHSLSLSNSLFFKKIKTAVTIPCRSPAGFLSILVRFERVTGSGNQDLVSQHFHCADGLSYF